MQETSRIRIQALPHPGDPRHSGTAEITGNRFTLGRGTGNDWVLDDPKRVISKTHAVIERRGGHFRVVDRSTNGTAVNGRALAKGEDHALRDGDEILIGGYGFRIQSDGPAATSGIGGEAPAITSILHDLAPAGGVGASSAIAGGRRESNDLATDGLGPIPGEHSGGMGSTPLDRALGGSLGSNAPRSPVAMPLGWDAPPGEDAPDIGATGATAARSRDLTDRSEQAPADRRLIDLPIASPGGPSEGTSAAPGEPAAPRPIIPPDWMDGDDTEETGHGTDPGDFAQPSPTMPQPTAPQPMSAHSIEVVPVTNLDVDIPLPQAGVGAAETPPARPRQEPSSPRSVPSVGAARPEPAIAASGLPPSSASAAPAPGPRVPAPRAPDGPSAAQLVRALATGAGIDPATLAKADPERLLINAGRTLSVLAREAHALQSARTGTASRMRLGEPERTPWLHAISPGGEATAPDALLSLLTTCEPSEIEGLRVDLRELGDFIENLSTAAAGTVEAVSDALEPRALRKRARFLDRFRSSGKATATWRAVQRDERLYGPKGAPRIDQLFAEHFERAERGGQPEPGKPEENGKGG